MTHKSLNTDYLLRKVSASIAIVFTALILVGCATNKSTGATASETSVDNSLPPISSLTLDAFLERVPANIQQQAQQAGNSLPIQQAAPHTGAIVHSSSLASDAVAGTTGPKNSIDTLIAEITARNGNIPTYDINYDRRNSDDLTLPALIAFKFSSALISEVQHVTPPLRNGMNLKLTAIEYKYITPAGAGVNRDSNFYFEIYTNHGESNNAGETYGDTNYLAIGTWLAIPKNNDAQFYNIGAFVNGANIVEKDKIASLDGTVSYAGAAYGFIAMYNSAGDAAGVAPIIADINLTADFNKDEVMGRIDSFAVRVGSTVITTAISGAISLGAGNIKSTADGGFFTQTIERSFLTFNGREQQYDSDDGRWSAQFYGTGDPPDRVAGTLAAESSKDPTAQSALYLGFGAVRATE